ncbi:sn-glycerol-1-phosphate dehydrogenase [Roseobacter sp. YSTF-M11]|uniref:Sn-glycerol-1-phosphate dehydrogenase n=1 Tax=Roseobacter insulae TaxID=2859783 RepID=A0A9X1FXD0_9RHOB|nr:sn-glycerol-1-phosphate dehydrogenase [Roseobacter insulae]MBW4709129.1 sn-glycerol-1-phosphate dehydrogenase [Roseobacter insulae]
MSAWKVQFDALIAPAVAKSAVTERLIIDRGAIAHVGPATAALTDTRKAIVFADQAGFDAAGSAVCDSLRASGFAVDQLVLTNDPLPKASVDEAAPFLSRLKADAFLFPVSVGSGVINDLVKFAAFETDRRYVSVATAASMDGYTSAGAPLARDGFKVTIPTRAPVALVADLDVIANAPAEMTGWGYGDLAGKSPAGGDWLLAELVGAEARDDTAWPLVQDHLRDWLSGPEALATGDFDACARLFIGLTAVGFAMEFHGTSRPASGADHQIAHMWEMEGHSINGIKVSHGAAVAVGCMVSLALYDWLLAQDLSRITAPAPDIDTSLAELARVIPDPRIADRAVAETRAKWPDLPTHKDRLARVRAHWPKTRDLMQQHLFRAQEMQSMLMAAGAPSTAADIGVSSDHLERTIRAAAYIRSRYTILDFLKEAGLFEDALSAVLARLKGGSVKGAAE